METIKVENSRQIPRCFTGIVEWHDGTKEWFLNGKRHREDGPARVWPDGSKHWYLNGKRHRVDGPAWEGADGTKEWWLNGKLHREDGPARVWSSDRKAWWLNDNRVFFLDSIGEYIVIQKGLPSTMEWLGKPVSTLKVLMAEGIKYIPNLPGI